MSVFNQTHCEIYHSILETWRSQVDSYWQRSSYFAAFETAALAGCWHLLEKPEPVEGVTVAFLGVLLTGVWFLSNTATHTYVLYWWNSLKKIEKTLSLDQTGLDFVTRHPGSGNAIPYRWLVQMVPVIFAIAWIFLFATGVNTMCATHWR